MTLLKQSGEGRALLEVRIATALSLFTSRKNLFDSEKCLRCPPFHTCIITIVGMPWHVDADEPLSPPPCPPLRFMTKRARPYASQTSM